jgi:hypothetical protein
MHVCMNASIYVHENHSTLPQVRGDVLPYKEGQVIGYRIKKTTTLEA